MLAALQCNAAKQAPTRERSINIGLTRITLMGGGPVGDDKENAHASILKLKV
jgi:hypothetical protein